MLGCTIGAHRVGHGPYLDRWPQAMSWPPGRGPRAASETTSPPPHHGQPDKITLAAHASTQPNRDTPLVAAGHPAVEVRLFGAHRGFLIAVRQDSGFVRQGQQHLTDRTELAGVVDETVTDSAHLAGQ